MSGRYSLPWAVVSADDLACFRESLHADFGTEALSRAADALFDKLEAMAQPTAEALEILSAEALPLSRLGFADRGQALLGRWSRAGGVDSDAFALAEAGFAVVANPAFASARMRARARTDPRFVATEVLSYVVRGDLGRATTLAREQGWFLDRPACVDGVHHALWALVLLGGHDEARCVIDDWRRIDRSPTVQHSMLLIEALLAGLARLYPREQACLEEAMAVAEHAGLRMPYLFTEPHLARARARLGDIDGMEEIVGGWTDRADPQGILGVYRAMALADIDALLGRWPGAERSARHALDRWTHAGHRVFTTRCSVIVASVAARSRFSAARSRAARELARCPVPFLAERLRWMEWFADRGAQSMRDARALEHTRRGEKEVHASFLWLPPAVSVGSDLYWDRAGGGLWLRGDGPHRIEDHPVLRHTLAALTDALEDGVAWSELHERVWGTRFVATRHEGRCHVTIRRLRKWLASHGSDAALVEVRDSRVRLRRDASVCVLTVPGFSLRPGELDQRVLDQLGSQQTRSVQDLAGSLGVGRTSLHQTLRDLTDRGLVVREGAGPSTTYRRAEPGAAIRAVGGRRGTG